MREYQMVHEIDGTTRVYGDRGVKEPAQLAQYLRPGEAYIETVVRADDVTLTVTQRGIKVGSDLEIELEGATTIAVPMEGRDALMLKFVMNQYLPDFHFENRKTSDARSLLAALDGVQGPSRR
ncbi:MAG: hypothetical protein ABIH41_02805 [Nanoarchaeota archaeon]